MKLTFTHWLQLTQNKCLYADNWREREYILNNNLPLDCSTKQFPILFRPIKQTLIGPINRSILHSNSLNI